MKSSEQKIYGRNACVAFSKYFPQEVIRAYCTESNRGRLGALLKYLAEKKRAYHIVTEDDLDKISDSEHHEGICLLIERPICGTADDFHAALKKTSDSSLKCVLCLDGISNPHNLGAIVRSAAHFGVKHILLCGIARETTKGLLSGAYHRTAEGGGVHVNLYIAEDGVEILKKCQKELGWSVVVSSSHSQSNELNKTKLPKRCILVMGSESEGINPPILALANLQLRIKGTGRVESLNVASATAIILNEWTRQAEHQRYSRFDSGDRPTRVAPAEGRNRRGS